MKAVLISVNKPNTDNVHKGIKTSELRTKPPKISTPFKVFMYETLKGGGCGKVVSEWECTDIKEWRMFMGIPAHLSKVACVSNEYIWKYCANGEKNIGEMIISNLVIYDKPKELSEFATFCEGLKPYQCDKCEYSYTESNESIGTYHGCGCDNLKPLKRPPQSWCYVESEGGSNETR